VAPPLTPPPTTGEGDVSHDLADSPSFPRSLGGRWPKAGWGPQFIGVHRCSSVVPKPFAVLCALSAFARNPLSPFPFPRSLGGRWPQAGWGPQVGGRWSRRCGNGAAVPSAEVQGWQFGTSVTGGTIAECNCRLTFGQYRLHYNHGPRSGLQCRSFTPGCSHSKDVFAGKKPKSSVAKQIFNPPFRRTIYKMPGTESRRYFLTEDLRGLLDTTGTVLIQAGAQGRA
jgi:hypothetical protein